jgi:LuxR family maltose regulon positive regulatory protein
LARILLADHAAHGREASLVDAAALLGRLLAAAEDGGRTGTVIEVLVLQALAGRAAGQRVQALATLERAARLAEPEGYVRVFAGEGAPMVDLLGGVAQRRRDWAFVRRLREATVAAVGTLRGSSTDAAAGNGADAGLVANAQRPGRPELIDPLSGRELDVLRFLCSDLDGPDIARQLNVSLSTVRTHTQHVYAKLGVNNRRAAVRRAHQLNLLSPTTRR